MLHTYVMLIQTVYRALLTSAISGIGHRITPLRKTTCMRTYSKIVGTGKFNKTRSMPEIDCTRLRITLHERWSACLEASALRAALLYSMFTHAQQEKVVSQVELFRQTKADMLDSAAVCRWCLIWLCGCDAVDRHQ